MSVYFSIMHLFLMKARKNKHFHLPQLWTIVSNTSTCVLRKWLHCPISSRMDVLQGVLWEMILYVRHQLVWDSTVKKPIKTSLILWHSIIQSQDTFYQRQQINIDRIGLNWHWNIFISFMSSNYAKIKYAEWIIIECELNYGITNKIIFPQTCNPSLNF